MQHDERQSDFYTEAWLRKASRAVKDVTHILARATDCYRSFHSEDGHFFKHIGQASLTDRHLRGIRDQIREFERLLSEFKDLDEQFGQLRRDQREDVRSHP